MSFLKLFDPDGLKKSDQRDSLDAQLCKCDPETESQCNRKPVCSTSERILQVIPGECSTERLVLAHVIQAEESMLFLRQQSFADGIGWFTQCSVEVTESQIGPLLMALQTSPKVSAGGRMGVNTTKLRTVS